MTGRFDERATGKRRAFDERATGKRPYAEVIGDPVAQSKSPMIHNFWLAKLGIEADYCATRVTPETLPAYLAERRADPAWRGCNVTMPLKQLVASLVDNVDSLGARVGAINTIVAGAGGLVGRNSDVAGFLEPLGSLASVGGKAALYGTGGAARAIAVALIESGWRVTIHGRTAERARSFADSIATGMGALAMSDPVGTPGLLVNASSLGMTGHPPLLLSLADVPAQTIIYDIVTSPLETALLKEARARGMRSFDGLKMLVGQAAVAFAHFFGVEAPRAHDAELRERLTT